MSMRDVATALSETANGTTAADIIQAAEEEEEEAEEEMEESDHDASVVEDPTVTMNEESLENLKGIRILSTKTTSELVEDNADLLEVLSDLKRITETTDDVAVIRAMLAELG